MPLDKRLVRIRNSSPRPERKSRSWTASPSRLSTRITPHDRERLKVSMILQEHGLQSKRALKVADRLLSSTCPATTTPNSSGETARR